MMSLQSCKYLWAIGASLSIGSAAAAPVTYKIDPHHTFPSFVADHNGLSKWRGKFNSSSGTVILDTQAQTGKLEILIDVASIDFGHEKMNEHAAGPDMFDVPKFSTATYTGKLEKFVDNKPTEVQGMLTLHGVSKPVNLKIHSFACKPHLVSKKEVCGADASGSFNREDFGIAFGKTRGFDMNVTVEIQVEAAAE